MIYCASLYFEVLHDERCSRFASRAAVHSGRIVRIDPTYATQRARIVCLDDAAFDGGTTFAQTRISERRLNDVPMMPTLSANDERSARFHRQIGWRNQNTKLMVGHNE